MAGEVSRAESVKRNQRIVATALITAGVVIFLLNNLIYRLYASNHTGQGALGAAFVSVAIDALCVILVAVGALLAYGLRRS